MVICERRAAEVTPAVCKASAGAVEHLRDRAGAQPRRLPASRPRRRLLVLRGGGLDAGNWTTRAGLRGAGVVIVFGAEGRGLRRRVAGAATRSSRLPLRGRIGSLNVNAAAGALL